MKPLTVCIQLCAVVVVLGLSYYLGRPLYYDSLVKSQDAASQSIAGLLSGTTEILISRHRKVRHSGSTADSS